jgi:hypothetical protein
LIEADVIRFQVIERPVAARLGRTNKISQAFTPDSEANHLTSFAIFLGNSEFNNLQVVHIRYIKTHKGEI